MQDPKETLNNIDHNTEMALLQSEKIAESVNELEPIMEGVLVKTDEMVQEMKKNNDKPVNETKIIFEGVEMTEIRGRDGKDGEKGEKGDKGERGERGEQGEKGEKGDKGDRGEDGINGYDGRDGLDGYDGKDGKDGIDGRDGVDGKDGKDGTEIKPEEIKQKLESLEVGLDYEKLSNVPDIAKIARVASSKTVSLNELDDVDLSGVTQTNGKYVLGGGTGLTAVEHDSTLTGAGTTESPLSVVATSASDVAVTVRAATTAALAGTWTYDNGTSGVGATLTRTTNGVLPNQDGISLSDGDRFLIKNQASTLANGVYVLTQKGVTSVSPTIFTRATDADETSELDELVVTISEGSTNRGTVWGQQTNNPTVGTSAIVFATVVSTAVTQATSGTQAINQIPLYTGTARQLTRGTANFKYNPTTDLFTIRGIDYTFPANNGDASQVLTTDGSGTLSWEAAGGGGTPAGSDTQIQYNNAGAFGADSDFIRSVSGGYTKIYNTFDDMLGSTYTGGYWTLSGQTNLIQRNNSTFDFTALTLDEVNGNISLSISNSLGMADLEGILINTNSVKSYVSNYNDADENGFDTTKSTKTTRLGSLSGGNGTKIVVDDTAKTIAFTANSQTTYSSDIPKSIKISISSAEILDLNTTPKELIPAPGAGKVIQVLSILSNYTYGTVTYATATNLEYLYGAATTSTYTDTISLASTVNLLAYPTATPPGEVYSNSNLNLHVQSANPTAGDGTLDIYITYKIVTL